eukprot:7043276-Prymnesium_polylepis.1
MAIAGPVSRGGVVGAFGLALIQPPTPRRADTLAPHAAIPRVASSSSLGQQVAFSPSMSAGPRPTTPR